ncbi:hypothetical protein ACFQ2M_20415 [Kitasatospora saccharophila]|uniref:hypothetical protein n=1 Tax=Kitasatospora saccharophila TaxID=407973 RepID=UPI00362DFF36
MFFVVAAAAPLTVLAGIAPFAIGVGGASAPAAYLISGALLVLFAAGFTAMSRYVRNAGAFYAYVARGLGRTLGVVTAYVAVVSYNLITPAWPPRSATSRPTTSSSAPARTCPGGCCPGCAWSWSACSAG